MKGKILARTDRSKEGAVLEEISKLIYSENMKDIGKLRALLAYIKRLLRKAVSPEPGWVCLDEVAKLEGVRDGYSQAHLSRRCAEEWQYQQLARKYLKGNREVWYIAETLKQELDVASAKRKVT